MSPDPAVDPLVIKDYTLTGLATGYEAQSLRELRDRLQTVSDESLHYHIWGRLLRPVYEEGEYNNDFADWAHRSLRDPVLAERLAMIDPVDLRDIASLRAELVEIVEVRLEEWRGTPRKWPDEAFHFIQGQMVVYDTHQRVKDPPALPEILPELSSSSIYYHFVDARHRSDVGMDDFQAWISHFGPRYLPLCEALADVDRYFVSVPELREQLLAIFTTFLEGDGDVD